MSVPLFLIGAMQMRLNMSAKTTTNVPDENGHISVMVPCVTCRGILAYLVAIQSPVEPEELISSILEGWVRSLNL